MTDEEKLAEIKAALDKWEKEHSKEFEAERKKEFLCESGIPIKRVFTPLDLAEKGFDYLKDLGLPGEYPYTRGITATGYRGNLWGISQYSGHPTPEESNKLWRSQIEAGGNLVYMAYDLPCQLGYDPDDIKADGEVGRVGVSLVSLNDWEVALEGIDIEKVTISQVLNAPAAFGIACHLALAEKRGADWTKLRGVCQNEILKEYIARGNYIFPPAPSVRLVADSLAYCAKYVPNYNPITVSTVHLSERGATPVHEAAFALANAFAYMQGAIAQGIDVDAIAPGMMFLTNHEHHGFFQEIAKLRAMRKVYAKSVKERFEAKDPRSTMGRWYSAQGGTALHREEYLNNIARVAISALAGALSGCQVIDQRAYDEQFGIPTKEALITSIRCQQVVAYETGVTDTVDPLAGSYFVEWLTSEFAERIEKELDVVDKLGGSVKAIEQGYFQRVMSEDAYRWQKAFEAGEVKRVGVNIFTSDTEEKPARIYRADPMVEQQRITSVQEVRRSRDNEKVTRSLEEVKRVAQLAPRPESNLMPSIIEAVKAYATVGEVCGVLREVWGEYVEPRIL